MIDECKELVDLSSLAARIDECHASFELCAKSAIEHARKAGELLIQVKASLGHGEWLPWLEANVSVSLRQAQRYMKLAAGWDAICKSESPLLLTSIDHALELLRPKPNTTPMSHLNGQASDAGGMSEVEFRRCWKAIKGTYREMKRRQMSALVERGLTRLQIAAVLRASRGATTKTLVTGSAIPATSETNFIAIVSKEILK